MGGPRQYAATHRAGDQGRAASDAAAAIEAARRSLSQDSLYDARVALGVARMQMQQAMQAAQAGSARQLQPGTQAQEAQPASR